MTSLAPDLESWFLHHDLVFKVLGAERAAQLSLQMPHMDQAFARARTRNLLEGALALAFQALEVPSLNELHLKGELAVGRLIWLEQSLHFRGIEDAYYKSKRDSLDHRGLVWGKLATDPTLEFEAEVNASRVTSDTGAHLMSHTRKGFMLAFIDDAGEGRISLRAVAVGQRLFSYGNRVISQAIGDVAHVWPQQVDQFKDVDFSRGAASDLDMLRTVPEEAVKNWFAEIVGQSEVPKDWGGEQYDLWTRFLSIDGEPVRAAIAFKGPAAFRPMQIADLGKNGDQIQRLAESPADLLVVQHCHTITSRVEHMLRTYATSPALVRKYMLIDGYATAAILKHFEYLPVE
ncbi:hypothetical protein [Nocardioides stalactiti]|uniref:hypothetical protein n=1 Tax=Nocardioides stalactiti TaxID=2755356 RepID=UPI0015FFD270|nr:hypothetical protein [Nocardioides stalactiti]